MTVDDVLHALRILGISYCWDEKNLKLWRSTCPLCHVDKTLGIMESGRNARLFCRYHDEADILGAFSDLLTPWTLEDAMQLAEEACRVASEALRAREAA